MKKKIKVIEKKLLEYQLKNENENTISQTIKNKTKSRKPENNKGHEIQKTG